MMLVKTEDKRYERDVKSRALLSTDTKAVDDYNAKRAMLKRAKDNEERINILEDKIDQVLDLLSRVLDKGKE